MKIAKKGEELQTYRDVIRDPYILDFTGLSTIAVFHLGLTNE